MSADKVTHVFDQEAAELKMAAAGLLDGYLKDTPPEAEGPHYGTLRTYKGPLKYTNVPACEHKFILGETPRHCNCDSCWFAFFQVHGEVTQTADKVFAEHGVEGLKQLQGKKFTKHFLRFMGTLAIWKAQMEAVKETDEQRTISTDSSATEGRDDDGSLSADARESAKYIEAKRKDLAEPYKPDIHDLAFGAWREVDIT